MTTEGPTARCLPRLLIRAPTRKNRRPSGAPATRIESILGSRRSARSCVEVRGRRWRVAGTTRAVRSEEDRLDPLRAALHARTVTGLFQLLFRFHRKDRLSLNTSGRIDGAPRIRLRRFARIDDAAKRRWRPSRASPSRARSSPDWRRGSAMASSSRSTTRRRRPGSAPSSRESRPRASSTCRSSSGKRHRTSPSRRGTLADHHWPKSGFTARSRSSAPAPETPQPVWSG